MKTKRIKRQKPWISILLIVIAIPVFKPVVDEIIKTIELSQSLKDVQEELTVFEAQNQSLAEQKDKLEDPEYVKSYARATYMLTKDGEQIYYLPQD